MNNTLRSRHGQSNNGALIGIAFVALSVLGAVSALVRVNAEREATIRGTMKVEERIGQVYESCDRTFSEAGHEYGGTLQRSQQQIRMCADASARMTAQASAVAELRQDVRSDISDLVECKERLKSELAAAQQQVHGVLSGTAHYGMKDGASGTSRMTSQTSATIVRLGDVIGRIGSRISEGEQIETLVRALDERVTGFQAKNADVEAMLLQHKRLVEKRRSVVNQYQAEVHARKQEIQRELESLARELDSIPE